jgi:hypothetical protein
MSNFRKRAPLVAVAFALGLAASDASASHSWGGYHWARTSNPFTIKLGDNVSANWAAALTRASIEWSTSSVLDTSIVSGSANPKNCRPTAGRVEVCNSKYGNNGWLGIAGISISGGTHITQGYVKLNDTYFNTPTYNTAAWRNMVTCQEIGHTFGLDHQDENFSNANLNTCMDYTNSPESNQDPNSHDYEQLAAIYSHADSTTTISQSVGANAFPDIDHNNPGSWGQLVKLSNGGRTAIYELNLGGGRKIVTFVIFALEARGNRPD